jgi:hypothetical protein
MELTVGAGYESGAAPRVDDPGGTDANAEIVSDTFLDASHAVFAGENFDAEKGRCADDEPIRRRDREEQNVRNSKAQGGYLETLTGKRFEVLLVFERVEKAEENSYEARVWLFADVALEDFAVDVVAAGTIDGPQVLFDWDESWGRGHGRLRWK